MQNPLAGFLKTSQTLCLCQVFFVSPISKLAIECCRLKKCFVFAEGFQA